MRIEREEEPFVAKSLFTNPASLPFGRIHSSFSNSIIPNGFASKNFKTAALSSFSTSSRKIPSALYSFATSSRMFSVKFFCSRSFVWFIRSCSKEFTSKHSVGEMSMKRAKNVVNYALIATLCTHQIRICPVSLFL